MNRFRSPAEWDAADEDNESCGTILDSLDGFKLSDLTEMFLEADRGGIDLALRETMPCRGGCCSCACIQRIFRCRHVSHA